MRVSFISMAAVVIVGISAAAQAQVTPATSAPCNLAHAPGVLEQQLMSGGLQRTYRLFVPAGYDGHTKLPLVLDLHPSRGTSAGQERTTGFEEVAAREVFAVVSPQADGGNWNVPVQDNRPDDVKYIGDVIDSVASNLCIDTSRIYATGFSGGARMSSLLGCMLNTRLAAIAPVSGLRWPAPCGGRPIPVLTFHGLADPRNTYDGHADRGAEWVESVPDALAGWAEHNGCRREVIFEDPEGPLSTMRYADCLNGAEVRLIRIDGLVHAWTRKEVDETVEIWQFFKSHRLTE
jgi:polyhydroxybutyrate depolymerase